MELALIGLGKMGLNMATRLVRGGHRVIGYARSTESVEAAAEIGIRYLTLYAFSTENWNRPSTEIKALMSLLHTTLRNETKTLMDNQVRLRAIGDISALPAALANELEKTMTFTAGNKGLTLILALSYSSRWEIMHAIRSLANDVNRGKMAPENIDQQAFQKYLATADFPDPELLIRTSGELRISNFLLWQIAYSELYFTDTLWPDFRKDDFFKAICNYQSRERRFGKISEQVNK